MLETARGLGAALRAGWKPRRTILLASWDGEEYGLLGSTEWVEERVQELQQKAVAYLNLDSSVTGADLEVSGSRRCAISCSRRRETSTTPAAGHRPGRLEVARAA